MSETILVIDDDETILTIVEKVLIDHGYTAMTAKNGEEGMEKLQNAETSIDGIILDVKMPGMDGNQVLGRIRNDDNLKTIPILMLTGENSIVDVSKSLELGANDYMVKPFDPNLVIKRLKGILS